MNLTWISLAVLAPICHAWIMDTTPNRENIVDFRPDNRLEWRAVNDGVMGGVSQSAIQPTEENTGLFSGVLSLENNGGFASVRTELGTCDLSEEAGLELRVKGDGRTYQVRLRTDDRFDGIAYRADFDTSEDEWITAQIPFDRFQATFRGSRVADAPPLDVSRIRQLAFMLADKRPGRFSLEIDYARGWREDQDQ